MKKKIYSAPMLKVSDLKIEACMLEATIGISTASDTPGAKANGFFDEEATGLPHAKSVWED